MRHMRLRKVRSILILREKLRVDCDLTRILPRAFILPVRIRNLNTVAPAFRALNWWYGMKKSRNQ